jgi:RNA polymerase sigma factor (TIGR02999 family)
MAGERAGHTLQATALVHEVYVRLLQDRNVAWNDRMHFFHAASEAMRRILIDHARARASAKRGGGQRPAARVNLDSIGSVADLTLSESDTADSILAFDKVFQQLEEHDSRFAAVVRFRFYAGLSVEETALALGVSERTVNNDWVYARAWLARQLGGHSG